MRKVSFARAGLGHGLRKASALRELFRGRQRRVARFRMCGNARLVAQFPPRQPEICINFEGCGVIHERPSQTTVVNPQRVAHYTADAERLRADRHAGQRHRFSDFEMSRSWLQEAIRGHETVLNREARGFLEGDGAAAHGTRATAESTRQTRRRRDAETSTHRIRGGFWFRAKIMEIAALTLIEPSEEFFCERHQADGPGANRTCQGSVGHGTWRTLLPSLSWGAKWDAVLSISAGASPSIRE